MSAGSALKVTSFCVAIMSVALFSTNLSNVATCWCNSFRARCRRLVLVVKWSRLNNPSLCWPKSLLIVSNLVYIGRDWSWAATWSPQRLATATPGAEVEKTKGLPPGRISSIQEFDR